MYDWKIFDFLYPKEDRKTRAYKREKNKLLSAMIPEVTRQRELLFLDKRYGLIDDTTLEKNLATIDGIPWIKIIESKVNPKDVMDFTFEVEYNQLMIEELKEAGYEGTESAIIDEYMTDLMHQILVDSGNLQPNSMEFSKPVLRTVLNDGMVKYE